MIDLFGKGSFLRMWLPIALLAILVAALFPPCHPRRAADSRAPWEGVVLLVSFEPAPAEPLRLIASIPLASTGGREERVVVGDLAVGADAGSAGRPLLLRSPAGELGRRLVRRAAPPTGGDPRSSAGPPAVAVTLVLHRARDLEVAGASAIGALLRTGEITAAGGTRPLPAPIVERPLEIRIDPSRHRRWPGDAARFDDEWRRLRDEMPGGLAPYLHARVSLPGAAPAVTPRSGR